MAKKFTESIIWYEPVYQNGFKTHTDSGFNWYFGYSKDSSNNVFFSGMMDHPEVTIDSQLIFTLPIGYRPGRNITFTVSLAAFDRQISSLSANITVTVNGVVQLERPLPSGTWFMSFGHVFKAE